MLTGKCGKSGVLLGYIEAIGDAIENKCATFQAISHEYTMVAGFESSLVKFNRLFFFKIVDDIGWLKRF